MSDGQSVEADKGGGLPLAAGRQAVPATVLLWAVAGAVVVADQVTKAWALSALGDGARLPVVGDVLGLVLVRNSGAAFSLAAGYTWVLSLVAVAVIVAIVRASRRLASTWWALVLGLVLGGAAGNLLDRLVRPPGPLRGHVVDFIDYGGYFVGNVADIAIVVAAVGLLVLTLGGRDRDGTRQRPAGAAGGREGQA
ncbi:signal peptidase II [Actinomyces sp. 2119]|uniref:Lipoprotein signal peptidase n=1 Tax=Actinomyces lilanjuaniae TaxID=2321394 RepID=A0ABM6Z338_9ACTO|nr:MULTISPECIES: signal peptidase II [Actinomyces]AYD89598.1 signal peptidase II [Actinomyces lilanjuaniae]RJF43032.1 signal peptidase II [Actinomyces sp. 2119]